MRATATAVLAAAMACMVSAGARADVTYVLVNLVYNQAAVSAGATSFLGSFLNDLSLTVSDAAVVRGSFSVSESGNVPGAGFLNDSGDLADFVSFSLPTRLFAAPGAVDGVFTANLTFAADGSVSSGSVSYGGVSDEVHFSGSSASFGGSFGSDQFPACGNGSCELMGQLVSSASLPVPEPTSAVLLVSTLAWLVAARKTLLR